MTRVFIVYLLIVSTLLTGQSFKKAGIPPSGKDIFGHPKKEPACLIKKIIDKDPSNPSEDTYTYNAFKQLVKVQSLSDGTTVTGTITYTEDGLLSSVNGYLNYFDMKFFYNQARKLEKITYKTDSDKRKEIETVRFTYIGDSIVQATRADNYTVGNEYISTFEFDKDYELVKVTGVSKNNIDESTADQIVFDFYPDVYNYAMSGSDFRFFPLLLCEKMLFAEGPFFIACTKMVKTQRYIDYEADIVKEKRDMFEIVVNSKNQYSYPTNVSFLFKSETSTDSNMEIIYDCK